MNAVTLLSVAAHCGAVSVRTAPSVASATPVADPLHGARSDERRRRIPATKNRRSATALSPSAVQDHRLAADIVRKARNGQKGTDHREGIDGEDEGDRERRQAQRLTIESVDRRRRARDSRESDRRQRRIDGGD